MRNIIIISVITFFLGFFTHSIFFPDLFVPTSPSTLITAPIEIKPQKVEDIFFHVTYQNGQFHPSRVTLSKGQYITVRNMNKGALMWLVSDEETFNTNRGYAEGEEIKNIYSTEKTFTVTDKLNSSAVLTVTVK